MCANCIILMYIWEFSLIDYFPSACNSFKDCSSCLSSGEKLACNWCEAVKRCSDGIDRMRQNWVQNGCVENVCIKFYFAYLFIPNRSSWKTVTLRYLIFDITFYLLIEISL